MPTPLRIAAQITVDAEPERVWQAAVGWPGQRDWIWATRVRGGHGAGAEVTGWTGIGPPAGWIAGALAAPVAARGLRSSLRRFARLFSPA
jgi:hypothetical protein